MKDKIQERSDYESLIKNNPRELLKAIKQHALNFQENRYDMAIMHEAFRAVYLTTQKEGESLGDYTKRFRVAMEVMESHIGGPIILTKIAKSMPDYSETDKDKRMKCERKAYERYMAYVYMVNADQAKYGSIMNGLSTQKSLGNDQYPKTISAATSVLSSHRLDNYKSIKQAAKSKKEGDQKGNKDGEDNPKLSFAQAETVCYCCGKPNHKSTNCRLRDKIPKDEWKINTDPALKQRAQSHAQSTVDAKEKDNNQTKSDGEKAEGWAGVHMQLFQCDDMQDVILLDNQSTATIFCNAKMVNNIRETKDTLQLKTNAGVLVTNYKAVIPGWGEAWFNPTAVTNIFSFSEMKKRGYRIDYSNEEDAFIVHLPNRKVKFTQNDIGLYVYKPNLKGGNTREMQFVTTLEENKTFFTERQFDRAKRARDLYHALGTPSVNDFKAIITMNAVRNNPVTVEDIKIAEKIFGPDIGALKGKTTRRKPSPVISDYIEIPRELIDAQRDVTLCIDAMKVNGLWFLTTISRNIYYRTAQWVESQTVESYREALRDVIAVYNRAGFHVRRIHCDNEFQDIMKELVQDEYFDVEVNYYNPQEHVPEAERNNRVLKERVRATYHRLPYNRLPKIMVKTLVSESARKLNFFPARHGISRYYSPRMILHQQALDYNKHCRISFGTYVQGHDEPQPSNTQQARTLDCIYLRPTASAQGGHDLFHIPTNRKVTRRFVTPIPITPSVIKEIENLATSQQMPPGLKIETKSGHLLFDSAWLAGVEYDEEAFDDGDYTDDESTSQDDDDELYRDEYYDEIIEDEDPVHNDQDENQDNAQVENINNEPRNDDENNNDQENDQDENLQDNVVEENENDDIDDGSDNMDHSDNVGDEEDGVEEAGDDEDDNQQGEREDQAPQRSQRTRIPNRQLHSGDYVLEQYSIDNLKTETVEYSRQTAKVIARVMCQMALKYSGKLVKGHSNVQTFSLRQGIRKFGARGKKAALKELKQLHDRVVFMPINVSELSKEQKRQAMESLIFLAEKRDGTIKGRACANGSIQRTYINKDEATSPTVGTDALIITGVIDAHERRDTMTADVPNAFVQTEVDPEDGIILMKIRGEMVDLLLEIDEMRYRDYVVIENNQKVLYVKMGKALYGMLKSSLLYYKKFRKDIESIGFKVNPYEPCVANRIVNGSQHTIVWHVDDIKSSHVDPEVNKEFLKWLNKTYADDGIAEVKATFGKVHDYLGMTLDFSEPGILKVDMRDYVEGMIQDFPEELTTERTCPWTDKLFKVDTKSEQLDKTKAEVFHTFVAKGLFLSKRGRQDIQPAISFLTTRVRNPTISDWAKLKRVMEFLKTTQNDVMKLSAHDITKIQWYLDAAFAVHPDMKGHTGACMTFGCGAATSISTKHKTNSRSSTESELISMDDIISKVLWTKRFMEAQGVKVTTNVIYRDNTSSMKLEETGKASSGKRTRHFDIKYFYITDLIKQKEVSIEYCPTDDMIADYMTKPLTGAKFQAFRKSIMGN